MSQVIPPSPELNCRSHHTGSSTEVHKEFRRVTAPTRAKICQEYRFIMIPPEMEAGSAACRAALYSGIHQVNQPFIMYAGFWRAGILLYIPGSIMKKKKKRQVHLECVTIFLCTVLSFMT